MGPLLSPFWCAFSVMKKLQITAWLVCEQFTCWCCFHCKDFEVSMCVNRLKRSLVVFDCTAVLGIKNLKIDLRKLVQHIEKNQMQKSDLKKSLTNLKVCLHVVLLLIDIFIKLAWSPRLDANCFREQRALSAQVMVLLGRIWFLLSLLTLWVLLKFKDHCVLPKKIREKSGDNLLFQL